MLLRYACGLGLMLALVLPLIAQQQENATAKAREEFISLKVENRPFSDILDHVQEITRQNIIYDSEIKDTIVSVNLKNLPWRQFIETIAKANNCLVEDIENGITKVSKPPLVTMEFEGADIRDIINHIAIISNRNIVISEQVKGTVSLRLKDVPWQDALESVIKTRGYVMVQEKEGRIFRIVPPQEIETQLETRIFKLRFIRPKSAYVAKMTSNYFKDGTVAAGGGGRGGAGAGAGAMGGTGSTVKFSLLNALETVLTPNKGRLNYDENTNTLIITDVKPQIDKMTSIINELDKEPRQVFLDIKFIRTTNSDVFDFGVDTGDDGIRISQSFGSMSTRLPFTLGKGGWEDSIAAVPKSQLEKEGFPNDTQVSEQNSKTAPITFGSLDFTQTKFTLRLLKKDVKSKVVQAPKIITLDNHEATIFVGRSISYARTEIIQNDNGVPSVEIQEAEDSPAREGFQILVVPHIIPDTNKIQLTVIPSNDQLTGTTSKIAGFNTFTAGSNSIDLPEITQQVLVTHMILESGQTAVLGGLLKVSQAEVVRKVPFLGDIPFLGYFFKYKSINKEKEDLFIFITPRIVDSAENTKDTTDAAAKVKLDQQRAQYESIWRDK